ncbi:DoxX subfamily, putative [Nitrosococcus oceani AFC27]|nr:DoxX subfamily, putative [Nitrosococcus oceani AFC27]KFI18158.1 GntR family transcriptional regulator [Nitrosococcus oceani C-27]KFI21352.1 GntR family transcriptional regulator [Nitrosococcus oceani]
MNWGMAADGLGKLILRLTLGILVLFHGINKITYGISGIEGMLQGIGLPASIAYGVYIGEILGPILLLLGWYARLGAGLIAINMLFALFLAHRPELLNLTPQGGWALELQGMFLFTALALILTGPGRFSLNNR